MALIEREALKKRVKKSTVSNPIKAAMGVFINTAPTIDPIRAASGCRCGECAYYCADARACAVCGARDPNDFCSVGEIDEEA